jgi:glycosyltransferase involved in cell wall biosynthesis
MEIIHLIYDHPRNPWLGGGAALRAKNISPFFRKQGDTVNFVSGGFPLCIQESEKDQNPVFFTSCSKKYLLSRLLFSLKAGFIVRKLSKAKKIDLLVEDISIFNIIFPRLFWKGPMISLVHNYLGRQSFKKLGIFGIIPFLMERHYLKHRKNFIAVSESLKKHILELNPKANVTVIYNGIDESAFSYDVEPQADKIGFIGRIEINQKGLDTLVQALSILKSENVFFKALLIGGGKDEQTLKKMIAKLGLEDSVEITGRLDEKRFARLSECRIACMPSRFEGWGITAIEAAAEGIPVIASDIDGLREAVRHNETGILIETTPQSLAHAIKDLMNDPAKIQALSQNAKKHASKFHWDAIAKEQHALYESLI